MNQKSKILTELKNENEILLRKKSLKLNNYCPELSDDDLNIKQMIESKIDFNSMIIQERNQEIEEIFRDVLCIKEIFADLNKMVEVQHEQITNLESNVEKTEIQVKNAVEQITKAKNYYDSFSSTKNKFILFSVLGIAINAPIALFFGLKVASISSAGAIGLSAVSSLITKK
jgi:t-SNARE complex subunit (syntaxin)